MGQASTNIMMVKKSRLPTVRHMFMNTMMIKKRRTAHHEAGDGDGGGAQGGGVLLQQVKSQQVAVTFVHLRHHNTHDHIQQSRKKETLTSGWPPTQWPPSPKSEQQERGRTTCSSTVGFRAGFLRHTWPSCRHHTRLLFSHPMDISTPAHHTSHHASFSTQWISPTPHLPGFLNLLCHESTAVQLALGHVPSPAEIV